MLDGQGQKSEGQKPPCFLCQSQPQIMRTPVSRFEALCGPSHSRVATVHLPHRKTRRGPRVARCGQMLERIQIGSTKRQRINPQPTYHFFARFLGQCRRSILQQDKAVAPPLRTPSRNAGRKGNLRAILANGGTFPGKSSDIIFWDFGHIWLLVCRKRPPLSHFQWLRYGSYSVFPEKTPSKSSLWRICNDRRKDPHPYPHFIGYPA